MEISTKIKCVYILSFFLQIGMQILTKVKEIMCEHSGGHSVRDWGDDNKVLSLRCILFIQQISRRGEVL